LIGTSAIVFGKISMPSMKAPLWTASCKIETNVLPYILPFQKYMGSWTPYGIKPRYYWEHLEERIWEHFENLMWTHWEQFLKHKIPLSLPLQKEKLDHSWVHAEPSHWLMKFLFPKLFVTIFRLG
jgi:hypothetical protein